MGRGAGRCTPSNRLQAISERWSSREGAGAYGNGAGRPPVLALRPSVEGLSILQSARPLHGRILVQVIAAVHHSPRRLDPVGAGSGTAPVLSPLGRAVGGGIPRRHRP